MIAVHDTTVQVILWQQPSIPHAALNSQESMRDKVLHFYLRPSLIGGTNLTKVSD